MLLSLLLLSPAPVLVLMVGVGNQVLSTQGRGVSLGARDVLGGTVLEARTRGHTSGLPKETFWKP